MRLANFGVLEETIRSGVNSTEYFGLAAGTSEGRYLDLKFNQPVGTISNSDCLVKQVNALKQLAAEKPPKTEASSDGKQSVNQYKPPRVDAAVFVFNE